MDPKNPFSMTFKASPLTLDRILEGRPIAAHDSPLFKLPVEILSEIIKYIESDRETLATLAFVNSDCRQLARSCQFANVVLDDSERSHHLYDVLVREATERSMSITWGGLTRQPSLGACIRYITSSNQHRDDKTDVIDGLRDVSIGKDEGNNEDKSIYDPRLNLVLTGLPHLETINWRTQVAVERDILTSLRASTVRHLKLHGYIDPETLPVELEGKTLWPLLSLDIDIDLAHYLPYDRLTSFEPSPFFNSLFQACSSTLQFLKFKYYSIHAYMLVFLTVKFSRLCSLYLGVDNLVAGSTLRSFLQARRLSTLLVDFNKESIRECLDEIGYFPKLHTLIWTSIHWIPNTATLRCLEQNNHLKEFGIATSQLPSFLERVILVLASFPNLKVLSLIWQGTTIPDSSLTCLALLTPLEKLHISSGYQTIVHNWLVDHDAIRNALSPLRKLKRILFTRDGYSSAYYYDLRQPDAADLAIFTEIAAREGQLAGANLSEMAWEWMHRERMARHAENYVATFPDLEWIHLGQLSFTFEKGVDGKQTAVVVDRERKECSSVLETMFGIPE